LRRLKNAVLVEEILKAGTSFEVEVDVHQCPAGDRPARSPDRHSSNPA